MKIDFHSIIGSIKAAPRAVTIPAAVFVSVLVLALGAGLMKRAPATPTVRTAPAAKVSTPSASAPAATPAAPPATSPSSIAPADPLAAAGVDPQSMKVVLPGIPAPAGVAEQRAAYTLEAAQVSGFGSEVGAYMTLGSQLVEARASSFGSLPVSTLATVIPDSSRVRESWAFWFNVAHAGEHLLALKTNAAGAVLIDGQARPAVDIDNYGREANGVASVELGAGWHQVTVRMEHRSSARAGEYTASLFVRGPGESAPVSIIPAAVDTKISAAPAASSAAASAPAAVTTATQAQAPAVSQ